MDEPARSDQRFAGRMRAAQDGDSAAYAALLRDLLPLLRQAVRARRSFLQPQDVEDLVQDILLSLHAVRATYDPSRPFRPWLMAIVHNRMVDGARRYARRAQHEVGVAALPETFSTPAANMTASYRDPEALRQAVRTLPRGQREAIEMLKLREMSLKEASAASGTSIGALKVAAHRGMLALRKALTAGERA